MLLEARTGLQMRTNVRISGSYLAPIALQLFFQIRGRGYRFQKRKSKSESAENTQILFNASIRVYFRFLPSKDKWYLEDTKRANLGVWGSERGICVCVLTTNDTTRGIIDMSVSLWEAAEDICGESVKGFVVKDINVPYRAREDSVEDTKKWGWLHASGHRKRYIPLKKTRHWGKADFNYGNPVRG